MKWLLLYSDCLVFPSFVCCGTWPSPVLVSWLASCPGYWHLLVLGCSLLMWLLPLLSSCFKSSHFLFFHLWYPVQACRLTLSLALSLFLLSSLFCYLLPWLVIVYGIFSCSFSCVLTLVCLVFLLVCLVVPGLLVLPCGFALYLSFYHLLALGCFLVLPLVLCCVVSCLLSYVVSFLGLCCLLSIVYCLWHSLMK